LLHGGEAEALALAFDLKPDWFLTDDAAARLMAESLKVETHGSIGVLLWAASQRLIGESEAKLLLANLENSPLWMSAKVRSEARAALEKIHR
jgi:predicted nucleic acid-binding protein